MPSRLLAGLLLALALAGPANAKLRVFACEPEWGALLAELGGDRIAVDVATTALQDVHRIEARPSLIARLRRADLAVCTGAELEIGWLPQLLRQSGNPRISTPLGMFEAAAAVTTLQKPNVLDRAAGDVHPLGNPHIQMDPRRILQVAKPLSARLQALDPGAAAFYLARRDDFAARWTQAIADWERRASPLRGRNVVVHHDAWIYLTEWLGLHQVGALEPRPGVPPSSAHLAGLIATTEAAKPLAILRAGYQDGKASAWLAERTGVPAIALPFSVGGNAEAKDLFSLFDSTIALLLGAAR